MLVMELGRREWVSQLTFSPDGQSLVTPGAEGVHIWRAIADGQRAEKLSGPVYANAVRFSPDGQWLFAGRSELFRIDPSTGASTTASLWNNYSFRFDVSPSGEFLLLTQQIHSGPGNTTLVALWRADDFTTRGKVWEREVPGTAYLPPHFLPGGERFARVEGAWVPARFRAEYHVVTYDASNGATVHRSATIPYPVYRAHFSTDGSSCALRDTNRLDIWPLTTGAGVPIRVRNDNLKHFTDAVFHPSGKYLAATSNDETVKLFDTATWREARTFTWKIGRMRSITFSPDGALAAAGSDKGKVVVWDVDL